MYFHFLFNLSCQKDQVLYFALPDNYFIPRCFGSMQGYSNSLPSNLLTANVHAGRESDLSYSPFSTQAMPAKYGNSVSSVGGSSISMPEV